MSQLSNEIASAFLKGFLLTLVPKSASGSGVSAVASLLVDR